MTVHAVKQVIKFGLIPVTILLIFPGWSICVAQDSPSGEPVSARVEAGRHYETSLVRFTQRKYQEAIIYAKNALQQDSLHLPARILLGKAFLASGQPKLAESELILAQSMGADRSLTDISLAETYFKLRKFDELLSNINPEIHLPADAARILVFRGQAYLARGNPGAAASAFDEAAKLDPEAESPLLGRVLVHLHRDEPEKARQVLDQAIALDPDNDEAWVLKGKLAQARGNKEEAIAHLSHALELRPDSVEALLTRATLAIELGQLDMARSDLDVLHVQPIPEPMAAFLLAVLNTRNGQEDLARKSLDLAGEILDKIPPDFLTKNPQMLLLAGMIEYTRGNLEKATVNLERLLVQQPDNLRARQVITAILLAQGEPRQALNMIQSVFQRMPEHPRVLMLKGRAHLGLKEYETATRLFEQAAAAKPNDPAIQMDLARSRIGGLQIEDAMEALASVMRLDADDMESRIMLVILHLNQGAPDEARAVIETIVDREPDNPLALNLLGVAQLAGGDSAGARSAFTRVLELDADHLYAKLNLAKVDIEEGRFQAARERCLSLLKDDPEHQDILDAIAGLEEAEGDLEQAILWREKIRALRRDAIGSNLNLADLYIRAGRPEKAFLVAENLSLRYPDEFRVLYALGIAEMAAGRDRDAEVTFRNLVQKVSYDASKLFTIAQQQILVGDQEGAYWTLIKTVSARPDWLEAQEEIARIEIRLGKVDDVLGRARKLQSEHPKRAVGHILEGDVYFEESRYPEAEAAYLRAQGLMPSPLVVRRLYHTYRLSGRADEALAGLETWLGTNPDDADARELVAAAMSVAGRFDEARAQYAVLRKQRPEDPDVLNNLAMLYQMVNDPLALELARKAYRLSPSEPLIADTLGWVLVSMGSPQEGLRYLREAQSREARLPDIGYHLAVALHALGRSEDARAEILKVVQGGQDFIHKDAAASLLEQLDARD